MMLNDMKISSRLMMLLALLLVLLVVIGVAGFFGMNKTNDGLRSVYEDRTIPSGQIAEIQKLKDQTAALLARKRVVETLQGNRSEVVHLLDQLVRQLPDGVYLKSIKQSGPRVTINGFTQSQARVSTLMRNLESSPQLEDPGLVEIKAVTQGGQRINEFFLNINITRTKVEDDAKKAAPRPAAKG